jgi:HAE1 family hydrophobic/amphiphilic exporter-1
MGINPIMKKEMKTNPFTDLRGRPENQKRREKDMQSWIKFSLKNAGVIFIAMLMVIAGGIYSVKTMKMESMPNVDIPYIIVQVPYLGATPEQGLEDIGKPLESTLSGIKKLDNLYVEAHSNVVVGILEFDMSKDMDEAEKDVTTAVASMKLPEGAEKPQILKDGPSAMPVFQFALSSETALCNRLCCCL